MNMRQELNERASGASSGASSGAHQANGFEDSRSRGVGALPPEKAPRFAIEQVLNLAELQQRVDGDAELLLEIVNLFIEHRPNIMGELQKGLAAGDCRAVEHAAHQLKGSIGNFAALIALQPALELEMMGRGKNLTGAEEVFARLNGELDELESTLRILTKGDPKPILCT